MIILGEKHKKKTSSSTPGALYPKNDLKIEDIETYKKLLDVALEDERINNIAVTAPYGVGKSTVLESYFNLRKQSYPWHIKIINWTIKKINKLNKAIFFSPNIINEINDFEFIILPKFFTNSNDKNELQNKVVEQLLFSSNPKKYPFSKLKRIKDTNWKMDISISMLFLFISVSLFYLYKKSNDSNYVFNKIIFNFNKLDILLLTFIIFFIIGCLIWFVQKTRVVLAKSTISGKGTLGPLEITSIVKDNNEIDMFNIFSEELLYYFRKSRTKIIIFEDLDRFGKPQIFQELRELNININKRKKNVVFIYSLQDKVFDEIIDKENKEKQASSKTPDKRVRTKAKFFDFVVPIFPVTSLYNSSASIETELKKYRHDFEDVNNGLSKEFIRSMGLFLKDQRMIILIVSEFNSYLEILNLKKKEIIDYKILFSTIVYKNFYAEDFEKIGYGSSLLNNIFDNIHLLYSELTNINIKNLKMKKNDLEKKISDLKHQLNSDLESILDSNYWKLKNKYNTENNNFENHYFQVNQQDYDSNKGIKFYTDIVDLSDSTQILIMHRYYGQRNSFTVKDAFEISGRPDSLKFIAKKFSEGKVRSGLISDLKKELLSIDEKIKDESSRIFNLQTGELLKNLVDIHSEDSEFYESLKEIREDNFKRYLFFNNLITPSFYSYISPIEFSDNQKDSNFIESVLSYQEISDYQAIDVNNVLKELDSSGANYSYAYSSNLLAHLISIDSYLREKGLILDKMIEKNDFKFWGNMLSYSKKKELTIVKGIILFVQKSKNVFIHSLSSLSESNNRFLVEALFKNIDEISSQVSEEIIEEIITYLINERNSMSNVIDMLKEDSGEVILTNYRGSLRIDNVFDALTETHNENNNKLIKFIYIENLYSSNNENIEDFGKLFNINLYFDVFTSKIKDLNVKYLNQELIYKYFINRYVDGLPETYIGFREFIDFAFNEHTFYKEIDNDFILDANLEKMKSKLLEIYSNVLLEEESYHLKGELIEKFDIEKQLKTTNIEAQVVKKLISTNKLTYSYGLLESISKNYSIHIVEYLLSVNEIYPNFIEEKIDEFYEFLGEEELLKIIKFIPDEKDRLLIGVHLTGEREVWLKIHGQNENFFEENLVFTILQLKKSIFHKLLLEVTSGEDQAKILSKLMMTFPETLSLLELEEITGSNNFLSKISSDGKTHHKTSSAIPKNLMDVLNNLNIINYKNNGERFVLKRTVRNFLKDN